VVQLVQTLGDDMETKKTLVMDETELIDQTLAYFALEYNSLMMLKVALRDGNKQLALMANVGLKNMGIDQLIEVANEYLQVGMQENDYAHVIIEMKGGSCKVIKKKVN